MVSRWERGVTVPAPYFRERLCAVLAMTADELGLLGAATPIPAVSPDSPLILVASSHLDADKSAVSDLTNALHARGVAVWNSRQLSMQQGEASRHLLAAASALVVVLSPSAKTSRHVQNALAAARAQGLAVYGVWIEGDSWEACLPTDDGDRIAPLDARTGNSVALAEEIMATLRYSTPPVVDATAGTDSHGVLSTFTELPLGVKFRRAMKRMMRPGRAFNARGPVIAGLIMLIFAVALPFQASKDTSHRVIRGGVWTEDISQDPSSLIPNGDEGSTSRLLDQALYLPLFYGDANGSVHAGAATEVPTVSNGGISADGTIWTFHLRPHLVWSDGQPYDARDVDFTWKLWQDPAFGAGNPDGPGLSLIRSTDVSPDRLSIIFHLTQAYAPFLEYWTDGFYAPLPAHHFSAMESATIHQSTDNLDPQVTSGPFLLTASVPGKSYTLARNPHYYLNDQGLPYLDKVVFRVADADRIMSDLRTGTITSLGVAELAQLPAYRALANYKVVSARTSAEVEAMVFNFHNTILAGHAEIRQAIAIAIDHAALVSAARHGFGAALCTDHPSALHPGYQPAFAALCPVYDPAAANRLLDEYGWMKGVDGVREHNGARLEFEYSTTSDDPVRSEDETIIWQDLMAIGIKLDIQNYNIEAFFNMVLSSGTASPPTGAVSGRFDIAEYANHYGYDPDDSYLFACDQQPPAGGNFAFYCNPALDALYQQELTTVEPGARQQVFQRIHETYLVDIPFIALYAATNLAVVRKGTHNYQISPLEGSTISIANWWCDNGRC
jgi:peptide/nickel transport system substrate-binding protein